jgi:hypothetical protein
MPISLLFHLAEFVQIQAGDDVDLFVHVALGTQVLAEAGANLGHLAQPFNLLRLQLAFAIDDTGVDFQAVLSASISFIRSLSLRNVLIRVRLSEVALINSSGK